MRGILTLSVMVIVVCHARWLPAQYACDAPYHASHHRGLPYRPHYGFHAGCPCPACRPAPCEQPAGPAEVQGAAVAGAYAVPPQAGEVVGPSTALGIRGPEITLPAIRLTFPSIRFPSLFRSRQDAHMRVHAAVAPFVQQTPTVAIPPAQLAVAQGAAAGVQGQEEERKDLEAQEKRLDAKLLEIQRCLQRLEALQHAPPPPACPYPPAACDCAYHAGLRNAAHQAAQPAPFAPSPPPDRRGSVPPTGESALGTPVVAQVQAPLTPPRGRIIGIRSIRRLPATQPLER